MGLLLASTMIGKAPLEIVDLNKWQVQIRFGDIGEGTDTKWTILKERTILNMTVDFDIYATAPAHVTDEMFDHIKVAFYELCNEWGANGKWEKSRFIDWRVHVTSINQAMTLNDWQLGERRKEIKVFADMYQLGEPHDKDVWLLFISENPDIERIEPHTYENGLESIEFNVSSEVKGWATEDGMLTMRYINTGMTYDSTIIEDEKGNLMISSWGDMTEDMESRIGVYNTEWKPLANCVSNNDIVLDIYRDDNDYVKIRIGLWGREAWSVCKVSGYNISDATYQVGTHLVTIFKEDMGFILGAMSELGSLWNMEGIEWFESEQWELSDGIEIDELYTKKENA